ncbi:hypothetical protein BVC80_8629g6 [Macleaya cordata]|uniref:Protein SHORTAGE IN CHIASMATA 1 n=1 Tax=Macleaya cordata TaxID=56857 RepID=A0A200QGB3_MACCD|nr:hypothetical protein BVC80_8629g6 [Macleaya cordata]
MRTRFLNIDYFSHSSDKTLRDLNFLSLPVPQIDSSNLFSKTEILCFDSVSEISLEIDRFLQIDKPLSLFFSDVLPHRIDVVPNEDFPVTSSRNNPIACVDGRNNYEEQRNFKSQTNKTRFEESQNKNELSGEEKDKRSFKVIQFETPELDFFLVNLYLFTRSHFQTFSTISYPYAVSESVYLVEDMTMAYQMEQRSSYFVEDAGLVQDKICPHTSKYPLLEVNEFDLEVYPSPSMEEELHLLLQNIGSQLWTQKQNQIADGEDLLRSIEINNLECLLEYHPLEQCLEPQPALLNLVLEMDFICLKMTLDIKENPMMSLEASDVEFFPVITPFIFQEVQILDMDSFLSLENFFSSQTAIQPETCENMFGEDNSFRNIYESTVSHELALVDDSFKSFPLPVLSNDKEILSPSAIIQEILANLKPHPSSASDGIYLDWHLLLEDRWNSDTCAAYWNISEEIETYCIDSELKSMNDGMVIFDFVFREETPDGSNILERTEILKEPLIGVVPIHLFKDEGQKHGTSKSGTNQKVPILFESMPNFNDLDFFLNSRKSTVRRNVEPAVKETTDTKAEVPLYPSSNSIAARASNEVKPQQWDIEVHQVQLYDHMLDIISNFQKTYLAILENDKVQKSMHCPFPVADSYELLSLPKKKLMEWIKCTSSQQTNSAHHDEIHMAFVSLYAIKQMAWYLCFYGIHATHLYVDNLYRSLEFFRLRFSFLQSLIEDALRKVDNNITESHPSLSVIQGILRSSTSQSGSKILIVAEKVFWWPLKRLLTSMSISFHEAQNNHIHLNQEDALDSDEVSNFAMGTLRHSDCLLISYQHISTSFPFQMFSLILEYGGGSYGSSKISGISPKFGGLPRVHFLKVELEDFGITRALCEGVDVPQNTEFIMEGVIHSMSSQHEDINDRKFEDLLNFVPTEEKFTCSESSEPTDNKENSGGPMPASNLPFVMEPKETQSKMPSFPDMIVIVNTQNFDKEMLISRRSSYQKILAMEKGGVQVVEREINQPVDLIFSAAMCLVWYDCRNIGKKGMDTNEASSCIPLCVENIATNVLTSLSFAYSDCILVFEGESRFLTAIMESSDGLYAAAATLGVDLQLFCSYSSELTDEIVLSCMDYALKLNRGQYPKMLESETLAESFLTRFPSINPLSAHAILSSGGMLVEFFECSRECRIQAIGKYHIPELSVALFGSLCSFGEQEGSKSGMTECSSVSSASESNSRLKTESQRKRQKCILDPHTLDIPTDVNFLLKPLVQSKDVNLKPFRVPDPYRSWISSKSHEVDEGEISGLCPNDKLFVQRQILDTSTMKISDWKDIYRSDNLHEDLKCEVIDLTEDSLLDEDFFSSADTINFSVKDLVTEKDHAYGNSTGTRRLSFGLKDFPAFPTSVEINSNSDIWTSLKDHNRRLEDIDYIEDPLSMRTGGEFFEEQKLSTSTSNTQRLLFQKNISQRDGETPLSNAINSSRLQQGSPWMIGFLNKFREKSRIRQKSVLSNTASDRCGYSDSIQKMVKRKSPSILDYYRYQGGSKSKKIAKQNWQKILIQPLGLYKNEKASASLLPTWTPVDKRARQTLSFARKGNETQSKLVWSSGADQRLRKRCRKEL